MPTSFRNRLKPSRVFNLPFGPIHELGDVQFPGSVQEQQRQIGVFGMTFPACLEESP
jgi:hypothetical protein